MITDIFISQKNGTVHLQVGETITVNGDTFGVTEITTFDSLGRVEVSTVEGKLIVFVGYRYYYCTTMEERKATL